MQMGAFDHFMPLWEYIIMQVCLHACKNESMYVLHAYVYAYKYVFMQVC